MADLPNPMISIVFFLIFTVGFFIAKYVLFSVKSEETFLISIVFYLYIGVTVISQLFINVGLTNTLCGTRQWETAIFVTILPWLAIFLLLKTLLTIFPGWLIPFSNTFGYLITRLFGLPSLVLDAFKDEDQLIKEEASSRQKAFLYNIYNDPSKLINKIGNQNFDAWWVSMNESNLLTDKALNDDNIVKNQIHNFFYLKQTISEFIWYVLIGILTISISYNFIINSACSNSVKEMKARFEKHTKSTDLKNDAEKSAPDTRVYSSFE